MTAYNTQRRVRKAPKVEHVSQFDSTERLDSVRTKNFEGALQRAAESVRAEERRRTHRTYANAETAADSKAPKKRG